MKSKVLDVIEELEHKGFISHGDGACYLTESGFKFVQQGTSGRFLRFLNENPGIAILVSVVALIVMSIVALFK